MNIFFQIAFAMTKDFVIRIFQYVLAAVVLAVIIFLWIYVNKTEKEELYKTNDIEIMVHNLIKTKTLELKEQVNLGMSIEECETFVTEIVEETRECIESEKEK